MIPGEIRQAWKSSDKIISGLLNGHMSRLNQVMLAADEILLEQIGLLGGDGATIGGPRFKQTLQALDRQALAGILRQAGWDEIQMGLASVYQESTAAAVGKYAHLPLSDIGGPSTRAITAALDADMLEFQRIGMDLVNRLKGQIEQMTVAPVTAKDASKMLSSQTGTTLARSETLVNTGLASVQRRLHSEVEEALPEGETLRLYVGPSDKETRRFCKALVDKALTSEQIAQLDNGSGLPVINSCGGYNCRHDLIPVLKGYVESQGVEMATDEDIQRANAPS